MLSGNQKNTDSLCNFIMYRASIELLQFHCNISISFPYLLWRIFLSDKLECSYNINKGTIDSKILQGLNSMNFFHCASDCTFRRDNIATALIFTWAQSSVFVCWHKHTKTNQREVQSFRALSTARGKRPHSARCKSVYPLDPTGLFCWRCDSSVNNLPLS